MNSTDLQTQPRLPDVWNTAEPRHVVMGRGPASDFVYLMLVEGIWRLDFLVHRNADFDLKVTLGPPDLDGLLWFDGHLKLDFDEIADRTDRIWLSLHHNSRQPGEDWLRWEVRVAAWKDLPEAWVDRMRALAHLHRGKHPLSGLDLSGRSD